MWLVFLTYALWSSVFSLGKMALASCPPVYLTALRMLLAGAVITAFLLFRKKKNLRLSKKQWVAIGFLSLFSIYLTNVCEFWGLKSMSAARTCFLYSLSPLFSALFSYIHFKEKLTWKKAAGLGIGFLGFIPVLRGSSGDIFGGFSLPDLAIAGAALFSVYGWVLLRLVVKEGEVSPLTANGLSMLFGGLLAGVHAGFLGEIAPISPKVAALVGAMTLLSNILCYNLYGHLLRRFTATFLSFAGLLSPIFASLISWLLLGERPDATIFLSTGIISFGLWLVYQTELRQGYIKRAQVSD